MKYVGLDLHKKTIAVCVMDQNRKVLERRTLYCDEPSLIEEFFGGLGPFEAVVEATASYEWLMDLLAPLGQKMVLAHPGKLRVIAESTKKSDKLDAQVLAEFLQRDMIPVAHRPSKRQQELRRLVRHRIDVCRRRGQIQTKIRRILANYNYQNPRMFTPEGFVWLRKCKLSPSDQFVVRQLLQSWTQLSKQESATNKQIKRLEKTATNKEKEARRLLMTIPGVGPTISNIFLAEIGGIERFSSGMKIAAYVGLAPTRRESGGKAKELGITKQGSRWLRWALIQAAWKAVEFSTYWRGVHDQLAKRRGNKKAIVAIARRLITVMYALVKSGRPYDPVLILKSRASQKAPAGEEQKVVANQPVRADSGSEAPYVARDDRRPVPKRTKEVPAKASARAPAKGGAPSRLALASTSKSCAVKVDARATAEGAQKTTSQRKTLR